MDLFKAMLIGAVLFAGILVLPVLWAAAALVFTYLLLVTLAWFILQVLKHEDPDKPP